MAEVPPQYSSLHNLLYLPDQRVLLVCNGLSEGSQASCHQWRPGNSSWQFHSHPNKPHYLLQSMCGRRSGYGSQDCQLISKGRYAAQLVHRGGQPGDTFLIGGMVYDSEGHEATDSVRRINRISFGSNADWSESRRKLSKVRAFACAVTTGDGRIVVLGGHTQVGGDLERSAEILFGGHLPDMIHPRSGHGCTALPGGLLVAGGTRAHRDRATRQTEIFRFVLRPITVITLHQTTTAPELKESEHSITVWFLVGPTRPGLPWER